MRERNERAEMKNQGWLRLIIISLPPSLSLSHYDCDILYFWSKKKKTKRFYNSIRSKQIEYDNFLRLNHCSSQWQCFLVDHKISRESERERRHWKSPFSFYVLQCTNNSMMDSIEIHQWLGKKWWWKSDTFVLRILLSKLSSSSSTSTSSTSTSSRWFEMILIFTKFNASILMMINE